MRVLDPAFAAHLSGDVTTLCHCWKVIRTDGVVLGLTDHDRDLAFGGTLFQAGSGFSGSAMDEEAGLPAGASDVEGAFSSALITPEDLMAGRYDGARVEVYRVNHALPSQNMLLKVQEMGEVTMAGGRFRAELRPFTHRLQQAAGRIYARRCDAEFGGPACGLRLVEGRHRVGAAVSALVSDMRITVAPPPGFAEGSFAGGRILFEDGAARGLSAEIARDRLEAGMLALDLWLPLAVLPTAADRISLTVGCDKRFETCRNRFSNGLNFRGFPHMPGADFAYSYADRDCAHDGTALFP